MTFSGLFAPKFAPPFGGEIPPSWWNPDGSTPGANVGGPCLAAYQPKASGLYWPTTIAESYINQANPGVNDAALGTAPAWAAGTGWTFTRALGHYLMTGLVPVSDQSWSMIVQFSGATQITSYQCLCGCRKTGGNYFFSIWPTGITTNSKVFYENGGSLQVAPSLSVGNLCVAGNTGYRNGVADTGTIAAWAGATTYDVYIGCCNTDGSPLNYHTVIVVAFALYSVALAPAQVAARAAAMALI